MYKDPQKLKALRERYEDEQVLVTLPSRLSFINAGFTRYTLNTPYREFFSQLEKDSQFIMRYDAEENTAFQQIIPYVIIKKDNKYFVYNRLSGSGEQRLHKKLSIGFGGHINPVDVKQNGPIQNGLERELQEELNYTSDKEPSFIGFVKNHDIVLADHVGLVFELEVTDAKVKELDKYEGHWFTLEDLKDKYFTFEDWAKSIIDYIYTTH